MPWSWPLNEDRREDLLRALKAGEVGAAVLPISELALAGKRLAGLEAGMTVGDRGTVAWAVRKEDTALRVALDDYLGNVRRGPTWSRLVVEYFGDQALTVLGRARCRGRRPLRPEASARAGARSPAPSRARPR